jgi:hypothetical protein
MDAAVVPRSVVGIVALDMAGAFAMQIARLLDQAAAACDATGNTMNAFLAMNDAA